MSGGPRGKGGLFFANGGPRVLMVIFTQCKGGLFFENVGPQVLIHGHIYTVQGRALL